MPGFRIGNSRNGNPNKVRSGYLNDLIVCLPWLFMTDGWNFNPIIIPGSRIFRDSSGFPVVRSGNLNDFIVNLQGVRFNVTFLSIGLTSTLIDQISWNIAHLNGKTYGFVNFKKKLQKVLTPFKKPRLSDNTAFQLRDLVLLSFRSK